MEQQKTESIEEEEKNEMVLILFAGLLILFFTISLLVYKLIV